MIYLANAFSLSMLSETNLLHLIVRPISAGTVATHLHIATRLQAVPWTSVVGHAPTAAVFESLLGLTIPVNRISIALTPEDLLYVGQYVGSRLPEGATVLPDGATIRWYHITVRAAGVLANPLHVLSAAD